MLADIYVAKSVLGRTRMDLHRHATFACTLARVTKSLMGAFSRG